MNEQSDIQRRRGFFRYSFELTEIPQCIEDLLALFGRVIPTRVEYMWHRQEWEVYFISPDVPPVDQGMMTPEYMVRFDRFAEDGTELERPKVSFVPVNGTIREAKP